MNDILEMLGEITGDTKHEKFGYHCNHCGYGLDRVTVKELTGTFKKLFYCKNNRCDRFGLLTVVAKKKAKA